MFYAEMWAQVNETEAIDDGVCSPARLETILRPSLGPVQYRPEKPREPVQDRYP